MCCCGRLSSACSVLIDNWMALMGTTLLDEHIDVIKKYKKVYVALDKDATTKAISMMKNYGTMFQLS